MWHYLSMAPSHFDNLFFLELASPKRHTKSLSFLIQLGHPWRQPEPNQNSHNVHSAASNGKTISPLSLSLSLSLFPLQENDIVITIHLTPEVDVIKLFWRKSGFRQKYKSLFWPLKLYKNAKNSRICNNYLLHLKWPVLAFST